MFECRYCADYSECDFEDFRERVYNIRDSRGDCFRHEGDPAVKPEVRVEIKAKFGPFDLDNY